MAVLEPPHFGFVLRRHRTDAGLTQEELAERAQLSTRAVSDLERGVSTNPRPFTVGQLVQALELCPEDRHEFERAAWAGSEHGGLRSRSSLVGAQTLDELVSRDGEMHQITAALESVSEGSGTFLLFGGERGSGKTRLLQEVEIEAHRRGFVVVAGRCYATEAGTAYYPILEAISGLKEPAGAAVGTDHLKRIERILQLAAAAGPGSPAQRQLFDDAADVLERAARLAPVVLLVDDLECADCGSLKLLTSLAHSIQRSPILIATAFCDQAVSDHHPDLAAELRILSRERLADRIVVRRLPLDETTMLAGALMGHTEVSEEFAGFVYRRTKGLPLLIDQLVRALGGRLELRGEIGAGSMGRVFRAYDRRSENMVAAKLVLARAGIGLDDLLRFQRESAVLSTLDDPNIVRIYDTFTEEHATCIVMELLDGKSLAEVLHDGPLDLQSAKDIASQLASALSYAHSQSIIHRDIKPDNVMVLAGGLIKVTDFGIAQILPRDTMMGTIATTGMRIGTPLYMAPEQIEGKKLDGRTDIYAFGATLYHVVTGRPPFDGEDALAIAIQQVNDRAPAPSTVNPAVPRDWDNVILKALSKDPAQRFQSVKAMGDRIESLTTIPAQAPTRKPRRPLTVGAGVALVAVAVAAVLIFAIGGRQAPGTPLTSYLAHAAAAGQLSGTVLVAKSGRILLDRGYGFANAAARLKNGPRTEYDLGNPTTTSLIVADTLQATETDNVTTAETGSAHVSRTGICSVLPALWKCPASWKPVTIQSLIEGTSGLPDYRWGHPSSSIQQSLTACAKKPVERRATDGIRYSSCANIVMALSDLEQGAPNWLPTGVIQTASQRYPDQLQFDPATNRQLAGQLSDGSLPAELALGYSGPRTVPVPTYNDYYEAYSTAANLYSYDNLLFSGALMSKSNTQAMIQPRPIAAPPDRGVAHPLWTYGWKTARLFGQDVVYTSGSLYGYRTANLRFPADDVTVIVMTNNVRNNALALAIHAAGIEVPHYRQPPSALFGTYDRPTRPGDQSAVLLLRGLQDNEGIGDRKLTLAITRQTFGLGFDQSYAATAGGGLSLYGPKAVGSPADNLQQGLGVEVRSGNICGLSQTSPPSGRYQWSTVGRVLIVTRVKDPNCWVRSAIVPGLWTRVR